MVLKYFFSQLHDLLSKLKCGALPILASLVLLASGAAWPRTVLDLDAQKQPIALQDWGDYRIEKSSHVNATEVADSQTGWQPTSQRTIYPLTTSDALWIRFTVPPAPDAERWYLEIPYPSVDRVSLFTNDAAGQWTEQRAGDLIAVSKWPIPHRYPLMRIALSAEVPTKYLLRLENRHSSSAPLQFISESHFSYFNQRVSLILGIFFGLTALAAIIALLSAVSLRDPAYGFYAISVSMSGLTQAALTGIAGLHLWPHSPWWTDLATSVLPTLGVAATLMFLSAAISLPERSIRLYRSVCATALLGIAVAAALAMVPMDQRSRLFTAYIFFPHVLGVYLLIWAWRRGDRFAPWLIVGVFPSLLAGAYLIARNMDLVPFGFFPQHGTQIGVAIEIPIMIVILMMRSQHRRENARRVQGLDRIDPATGLINDHVFDARLKRMIARSERLKHQSAVLLIDIVNTEQTQRDYGRKAADDLPLRVAERLLSTAREIDSAARLSELRFGMLVEGPFSAEEAATLGPRIVARCMMPYKGLHMDCVARVRLAYALVPDQGSNASELLQRLAERLGQAPSDDKKAVFRLGESTLPARRSNARRAARQGPT